MKKAALIIGHSAAHPGATNESCGTSEYEFNEKLAHLVAEELFMARINPIIIHRDCSYLELPRKVNETGVDIAVSLHCNAFNKEPNGSEVLYYKRSSKGRRLASCIQKEVVWCLNLKDRGLKPCGVKHKGKAGDRGGYLLKKTAMPCVIVEPFFIDNDESLRFARAMIRELAAAYASGITDYFRG